MKPQGIKTIYGANGKVKSIIINANTKTELVEDLIDTILYETHKDEPTTDFDQIKARLDIKHKIK